MKNAEFFWIVISIVCFIIELLTPTFFFLSITFAGLFSWLSSFFIDSILIQVIIFLIFFLVFFFFIRPVLYKNKKEKFNSELLIGKILYAKEDINEEKGSINLDGSIWQARSEKGLIEKGSKVSVLRIDGNKLIVTKEM